MGQSVAKRKPVGLIMDSYPPDGLHIYFQERYLEVGGDYCKVRTTGQENEERDQIGWNAINEQWMIP